MNKIYQFLSIILLLSFGLTTHAVKAVDNSGTVHYRNGQEAAFTEMGLRTTSLVYKVVGKLNAQDITYYFPELSQIHFMETDKGYYLTKSKNDIGKIRIVNRSGSPFILNDAYIQIGYFKSPDISYRHLDPATNSYRWSHANIKNNISNIIFN